MYPAAAVAFTAFGERAMSSKADLRSDSEITGVKRAYVFAANL